MVRLQSAWIKCLKQKSSGYGILIKMPSRFSLPVSALYRSTDDIFRSLPLTMCHIQSIMVKDEIRQNEIWSRNHIEVTSQAFHTLYPLPRFSSYLLFTTTHPFVHSPTHSPLTYHRTWLRWYKWRDEKKWIGLNSVGRLSAFFIRKQQDMYSDLYRFESRLWSWGCTVLHTTFHDFCPIPTLLIRYMSNAQLQQLQLQL